MTRLYKLPPHFVGDSIEREIFKPQWVCWRDSYVLVKASAKQIAALKSDAEFYTDQDGPDMCPPGLKASARAVIKAINKQAA